MAALSGGKRDRMIIESVYRGLENYLDTLGWFDPTGRFHAPIALVDEFPDLNLADVPVNTLAISAESVIPHAIEMGARTSEHLFTMFVDFFAEGDSLGRHVAGDVLEYVKSRDTIPVYDYSDAGDPLEFAVDVHDNAEIRKPDNVTQPWQRHWYTVEFAVEDMRPH